ncbi:MAG: hypothetical protein KGZ58_07385 [Ignavibacteriales bacterium]|nr:hypothetical protein [Ignavibacteriales bacterium]
MNKTTQLWKTILRWTAVLPVSILGMILAFGLWRLLHKLTVAGYIDTDSWLNIVFVDIMSNVIAGMAFVYIGFKVAPAYQKTIAIILTGLLLIVSGSSLFIINFMTKEYFSNIGIVCTNIGSIACCISIYKGEMDEKEY